MDDPSTPRTPTDPQRTDPPRRPSAGGSALAHIVRGMPDPTPEQMPGRRRKPTSPHELQLPSGRHGLPRDVVVANQRERISNAMAETVTKFGYAASSVERVASRAGVSRRTFYEQFAGKEDAYLQTYDLAAGRLLAAVTAVSLDEDTPDERLRRCLCSFLTGLASEPMLTHMCIVDVLTAGPTAVARRDRYQRAFAELLERLVGGPDARPLPPLATEGLVGAIYDLVYKRVAQDQLDELPDLLEDLLSFSLSVLTRPSTP